MYDCDVPSTYWKIMKPTFEIIRDAIGFVLFVGTAIAFVFTLTGATHVFATLAN